MPAHQDLQIRQKKLSTLSVHGVSGPSPEDFLRFCVSLASQPIYCPRPVYRYDGYVGLKHVLYSLNELLALSTEICQRWKSDFENRLQTITRPLPLTRSDVRTVFL